MRNLSTRRFLTLFLFAGLASPALQANAQQAPTPARPEKRGDPAGGAASLERSFGLSQAEARRQAEATQGFEAEAHKIAAAFPQNFLASIVGYGRDFGVTLVFDRDVNLAEVQQLVDPALRPHLRIRRSQHTGAQIKQFEQEVLAALRSAKIDGSVGYDFRAFKLEVSVGDEVDWEAFKRNLSPELLAIVRLQRGAPALLQSEYPTGFSGSGVVWGGWPLHDLNGYSVCTAGFILTNTSMSEDTLVTAAHCNDSLALYYQTTDGTRRNLPAPHIQKYGQTASGRSYDYQVHRIAPIVSSGYMWIDSSVNGTYRYNCTVSGTGCLTGQWANVHPTLPLKGHLAVTNAIKGGSATGFNPTHPVGARRCKHGKTSGVSCGPIEISSSSFIVTDNAGNQTIMEGIVKVVPDGYMVIGFSGDSGGPVFTEPVYNSTTTYYDTSAAGLVMSAVLKSDGTVSGKRPCITDSDVGCHILYMPIDRINDHDTSMAVRTTAGYVYP